MDMVYLLGLAPSTTFHLKTMHNQFREFINGKRHIIDMNTITIILVCGACQKYAEGRPLLV